MIEIVIFGHLEGLWAYLHERAVEATMGSSAPRWGKHVFCKVALYAREKSEILKNEIVFTFNETPRAKF